MAEARVRVSCQTDCAVLLPSVDVLYEDVWTDPVASGRVPDAPFAYRYASLTTPVPTSAVCQAGWSSQCRITIHYPNHIHPLWSAPRQVLDGMGNLVQDNTCTSCHTPVDAMGAVQVPAGQLDLSGGASPDEPDHLVSYRELLFEDNAQAVNMGALQDIPGPVPVSPSMPRARARRRHSSAASTRAASTRAG
jgi:hypothetical protein